MDKLLEKILEDSAQFIANVTFQELINYHQDDTTIHRVIKETASRYAMKHTKLFAQYLEDKYRVENSIGWDLSPIKILDRFIDENNKTS